MAGNYYSTGDVYNSFLKQGLSSSQAANFTGVFSTEGKKDGMLFSGSFGSQSSENGGSLNPSGAFGFAQWNGDRQNALQSFAQNNGLDVYHVDTQTAFAVQEAKQKGIDLNSVPDLVNRFEVPAAQYRAGNIASATQTASALVDGTGSDGIAPAGGSSGSVQFDPVTGEPIINLYAKDGAGGAASKLGSGSQTVPQAIDKQTAGATADTKTIAGSISGFGSTVSGIFDRLNSSTSNLFVRAAMILTGLIILAAGVYMLTRGQINKVPIVGKIAKAIP